jgi:hypothetical protein
VHRRGVHPALRLVSDGVGHVALKLGLHQLIAFPLDDLLSLDHTLTEGPLPCPPPGVPVEGEEDGLKCQAPGRPSLGQGKYFRLLIALFEGIDS